MCGHPRAIPFSRPHMTMYDVLARTLSPPIRGVVSVLLPFSLSPLHVPIYGVLARTACLRHPNGPRLLKFVPFRAPYMLVYCMLAGTTLSLRPYRAWFLKCLPLSFPLFPYMASCGTDLLTPPTRTLCWHVKECTVRGTMHSLL